MLDDHNNNQNKRSLNGVVRKSMFENMREYFKGSESRFAHGAGRRTKHHQEFMHTAVSLCVTHKLLKARGVRCMPFEIMGITVPMLFTGVNLRVKNETAAPRESLSVEPNKTRFDSNGCRRWIWDYFHESCSPVELDKAAASRRFQGRRKFKKNGVDMEPMTCEQRFRIGTKDDLILEFKLSKLFEKYAGEHSGFTISDEVIGTMICDCIKPATGDDCCCPYGFHIIYLLCGLKQAYEVKYSPSNKCKCESCKVGGLHARAVCSVGRLRTGPSCRARRTSPITTS